MSDAINKPAHYNQGPIECIDAMKIVLTPEEFRGYLKGNVFKYLWREKGKNGIEDLRKGKDYYDRLIQSFDENEAEQLATGEVKPLDGWRFLDLGEVIRKGDRCFSRHSGSIDCLTTIGEKFNIELHYPTIRRNKFEVGERVVNTKIDECIFYKVNKHIDDRLVLCFADRNPFMFSKDELAPYIEDAK